jgi:hypothetical protein
MNWYKKSQMQSGDLVMISPDKLYGNPSKLASALAECKNSEGSYTASKPCMVSYFKDKGANCYYLIDGYHRSFEAFSLGKDTHGEVNEYYPNTNIIYQAFPNWINEAISFSEFLQSNDLEGVNPMEISEPDLEIQSDRVNYYYGKDQEGR